MVHVIVVNVEYGSDTVEAMHKIIMVGNIIIY